jgi:hypothetical protein
MLGVVNGIMKTKSCVYVKEGCGNWIFLGIDVVVVREAVVVDKIALITNT